MNLYASGLYIVPQRVLVMGKEIKRGKREEKKENKGKIKLLAISNHKN